MTNLWQASWIGLIGGCGIFEGSPAPWWFPPCELVDRAEVTDPDVAVFDLDPLGTRLDQVLGTTNVRAWRMDGDVADGPYPATLTVTEDGPTVAESRRETDSLAPPLRCASRYTTPVRVDVVFDDGRFRWTQVPLIYEVIDELLHGNGQPDDTWFDAAMIETTLDLRKGDEDDGPETVSLQVQADERELQGLIYGEGHIVENGFESNASWIVLAFCSDCDAPPSAPRDQLAE